MGNPSRRQLAHPRVIDETTTPHVCDSALCWAMSRRSSWRWSSGYTLVPCSWNRVQVGVHSRAEVTSALAAVFTSVSRSSSFR
jgi:hypothetical protein